MHLQLTIIKSVIESVIVHFALNVKTPQPFLVAGFIFIPGGDLLSHTATRAVSSALRGLTSVFGMGTGVTPSA